MQDVRLPESPDLEDLHDADRRLKRLAGLLKHLFPELNSTDGVIESPLIPVPSLQAAMGQGLRPALGAWFIKGDHALPVAGSIKARGGIYEVLVHAEHLAQRHGLVGAGLDWECLASPAARDLFRRHRIAVGSTGNLGLSVGVMAAALNFRATVHMSFDAKAWKKKRLRARGVEVVEHQGDFCAAVLAGRVESAKDPTAYFVDDENSARLFLGYSVAATRLQQQLAARNIEVDADHPLFVYLPCGVGGAPGGITFGLRHAFGDHVHCFFAEPVTAPCMLIRLASATTDVSIASYGLDGRTEADGLAVARASEYVAQRIGSLVSGIYTVRDEALFADLCLLAESEGIHVEPSATAAFRGPRWLLGTQAGAHYLTRHNLLHRLENATHILWTTGGAFVPDDEFTKFCERGRGDAARWRVAVHPS